MTLTERQIRQFETEGVLVVEDVIPAAVQDAIRAEYAAVLDGLYRGWQSDGLVPAAKGFFNQLRAAQEARLDWFQPLDISLPGDEITPETPFHIGPAVFDLVANARLLDIVQELIGPEITSNPIQHVRIKPPVRDLARGEIRAHVGGTDWHQDRAVAHEDGDATQMITVWFAMTDATPENGCLQAIPRTGAMLPHCPKRQTAIADGFVDQTRALPLPVRAGGIVILDPLTPHASLENVSGDFRWSFDLRYNVTGQPTGRAHFPDFIVRSAAEPESVLDDWQTWREMWRETRAHLSGAPHIPIHRWTADSPACA